jgi:hypothetical protein
MNRKSLWQGRFNKPERTDAMLSRSNWTIMILLFAALCGAPADETPTPTVQIPHVTQAPKLADFLNGTPREAELVITDFRQFDPHDGVPVTQPSSAYLSYDDKHIYVVLLRKDNPALIRARKGKRDNLLTDDRISIDTFHDHRRSCWFEANLYGIQMDGITTESGAPAGISGNPGVFDNPILRSKVNYQFNRELSLRLNPVLPPYLFPTGSPGTSVGRQFL